MTESTIPRPALELKTYPDPSLLRVCVEVVDFGTGSANLAQAMIEAMHANEGVGLAANQMGQSERLFVMSGLILEGGGDIALFNPYIMQEIEGDGRSDEVALGEGCLSLPGVRYEVPGRANAVIMGFQDAAGKHHSLRFDGLAAICAQHELDHLNGVTMLDRLSPLKASRARQRLVKDAKDAKRGRRV